MSSPSPFWKLKWLRIELLRKTSKMLSALVLSEQNQHRTQSVTHYSPTCPLTSARSWLRPALPNWSLRIRLKVRRKKRTRIVEIRVDGHTVVQPCVYDPRPQLVAGLGRVALVMLTWVATAAAASTRCPTVGMRKAVADAGLGLAVSQVIWFVSGA